MSAWVWILLGLTALGFVLLLVEAKTGVDVTERLGKALAILLLLALVGGVIVGFMTMDWE